MVLLRNAPHGDRPLLPLAPGLKLAVVGPLGDDVLRDWYSGSLPYRVTLLDALRERLGADAVTHTDGLDRIALRATSTGGYLSAEPGGLVAATAAEVGPSEQFTVQDWGQGVTTLRAAHGRYLTTDDYGLIAATAEHPDEWVVQESFRLERGADGRVRVQHIGSGRWVCVAAGSGALTTGATSREQAEPFVPRTVSAGAAQAARLAAEADVVVVVAGNDPHLNGRETEDRLDLALPPQQEEALRAAHAANPATVLLLTSSYPYAVDWAERSVPALLWSAHGGQEGCRALAEVLLGDHSPAGRLPQTWYRAGQRLPDLLDYDIISARATYLYLDEAPLYAFGHGLYVHVLLLRAADRRSVGSRSGRGRRGRRGAGNGDAQGRQHRGLRGRGGGAAVLPGGRHAVGDAAAQAPGLHPDPARPRRGPQVSFTIPVRSLGHWDVAHSRWAVAPGDHELLIGASSSDIRGRAVVFVPGDAPAPRPVLDRAVLVRDFDDCAAVRLVDRTREHGEAVESGPDAPGRLAFLDCDLGDGASRVTLAVSRAEPGEAVVEVHLGTPGPVPAAVVAVPSTGGRYCWAEVSAELVSAAGARTGSPGAGARGVRDVHLVLRGALRLAELRFTS